MTIDNIAEIIQSVLAIIGALKVISRYTPWKWDDAIFNFFDRKGSDK